MQYSEMITSLEYIVKTNCGRCEYRLYDKCPKSVCKSLLLRELLELVKAQKEENTRLKNKAESLSKVLTDSIQVNFKEIQETVIDNFVKDLKQNSFTCDVSLGYGKACYEDVVTIDKIEHIAKETKNK